MSSGRKKADPALDFHEIRLDANRQGPLGGDLPVIAPPVKFHAVGLQRDALVARRAVERIAAEALRPADAQLHDVAVAGGRQAAKKGVGRGDDAGFERRPAADDERASTDSIAGAWPLSSRMSASGALDSPPRPATPRQPCSDTRREDGEDALEKEHSLISSVATSIQQDLGDGHGHYGRPMLPSQQFIKAVLVKRVFRRVAPA